MIGWVPYLRIFSDLSKFSSFVAPGLDFCQIQSQGSVTCIAILIHFWNSLRYFHRLWLKKQYETIGNWEWEYITYLTKYRSSIDHSCKVLAQLVQWFLRNFFPNLAILFVLCYETIRGPCIDYVCKVWYKWPSNSWGALNMQSMTIDRWKTGCQEMVKYLHLTWWTKKWWSITYFEYLFIEKTNVVTVIIWRQFIKYIQLSVLIYWLIGFSLE